MIRRLQKIVKSILETSVGTRIASAWLKRSYLSKQRKRFQKYAEIRIKPIVRTLSENDDYTASFIGGTYSSSFTITSDEIN